jgi:hypothetical protein
LTAFPILTAANHRITSDPSPIYNCIAWAAGHSDAWWEPLPLSNDSCPRTSIPVDRSFADTTKE